MDSRYNNSLNLASVFQMSYKYYKSNLVDDKQRRAKLDVISGKIIVRNNMVYDRSLRKWVQKGRYVKIVTDIKTNPKSYVSNSNISIHKYPITFEIYKLEMGAFSPFRWREGGEKPVMFKRNENQDSQKIADQNIKNGTQMQFFFDMEWVAKINNLLWGRCRAKWFPRKTNPRGLIYFGKHAFWVVENLIMPLVNSNKLNQRLLRNPEHPLNS